MDMLGTSINHSDVPNFIVQPFLFSPTNKYEDVKAYSLLWPIKLVKNGEYVYRDYLMNINEEHFRSARLVTWFEVPYEFFIKQY